MINGSVADLPDGSIARVFDQRVPCSPPPSERVIELTSDASFSVSLDGMTAIHALYLEADASVTLVVTYTGSPQSIQGESHTIISRAAPITAISLVRVAGQATRVRLILGQGV